MYHRAMCSLGDVLMPVVPARLVAHSLGNSFKTAMPNVRCCSSWRAVAEKA